MSRVDSFLKTKLSTLLLTTLAVVWGIKPLTDTRAYAQERAASPAISDEQARHAGDLARLEEVAHAFRFAARSAGPGVVRIQAAAGERVLNRFLELEQEEIRINAELDRIIGEIHEGQTAVEQDADIARRIIELRQRQGAIRLEKERQAELAQPVTGSGIVYEAAGYVLTNNHVVANRSKLVVILPDEREYQAELVGTDPSTDLALLRIDAADLQPLRFGDSDRMQVGDWVIAVGAPFGLSHSVTHGIISAVGRRDVNDLTNRGILYQNFLQTDAAINPGNSGGPLVNLRGEVIGVNTAIATRGESYNAGIAFTIPSNMAVKVAEQLKATGEVARGWLGITMYELSAEERQLLGIKGRKGVMVDAVIRESPAAVAGVMVEDVILAVNDIPVAGMAELRGVIADVEPGRPAAFEILRGNRLETKTVELGRRPTDSDFRLRNARVDRMIPIAPLGVYVRTLMPRYLTALGISEAQRGVLILGAINESDELELKGEEIIVECEGAPVASAAALLQALESHAKGKSVKLKVLDAGRMERTMSLKVR